MSKKIRVGSAILAAVALTAAGTASADWLAADPGTAISLQLNRNGFVIRPIGGAWSHAVCGDVTAAELPRDLPNHSFAVDMLLAAAANGSLVNLFAEADACDEHGHPVVRNVRIQGP